MRDSKVKRETGASRLCVVSKSLSLSLLSLRFTLGTQTAWMFLQHNSGPHGGGEIYTVCPALVSGSARATVVKRNKEGLIE